MKLTSNQKKVLDLLLDKYENSKTYIGKNTIKQSFNIQPAAVWKNYHSDYAAVDMVQDFEEEMMILRAAGLIIITFNNNEISKISACNDKLPDYYDLLERQDKNSIISQYQSLFKSCKSTNTITINFCNAQLQRLVDGKMPIYDYVISENIIHSLDFILNNKKELMQRELSMLLFGDSKSFENCYRKKICKLLEESGDYDRVLLGIEDAGEKEKILLEEHNIYSNPSYVYLKGNANLIFDNGYQIKLQKDPIAISSLQLNHLSYIYVSADKIITVENLTSFHRVIGKNVFFIYLAGYSTTLKQQFLKKIYQDNQDKSWYHFGDIDPDGFYIFKNLKETTGINFHTFKMGIEELKKYAKYTKSLGSNDLKKAKSLIEVHNFKEIMQYMIENNCKLEQEIISMEEFIEND